MEAAEGSAAALRKQAADGDVEGAKERAEKLALVEREREELSGRLAAAQTLAEAAGKRAAGAYTRPLLSLT
jgi:hypothetical protein